MPNRLFVPLSACMALALSGCVGQMSETVPGNVSQIVVADYACAYATNTTTVNTMVVVPVDEQVTVEDAITCENGEIYACGDRDRDACIAYVEAILVQLPRGEPAPAG